MQPHAMDGLRKALERWPSPVEGDGLENRYGSLAHREFKSLPLRSLRFDGAFARNRKLRSAAPARPRGCQGSADARLSGLIRPGCRLSQRWRSPLRLKIWRSPDELETL